MSKGYPTTEEGVKPLYGASLDELLDEMIDRYDATRKRNWDEFFEKHFPEQESKK